MVVAGHLTNVCVTLFLHREQTHKGVRFHYLAQLPMRLWLWMTTAIVTKEWVACHRKHHAFADREGDPHSPHVGHGDGIWGAFKGFFHAHVGWLFDPDPPGLDRYLKDLDLDAEEAATQVEETVEVRETESAKPGNGNAGPSWLGGSAGPSGRCP